MGLRKRNPTPSRYCYVNAAHTREGFDEGVPVDLLWTWERLLFGTEGGQIGQA